MNYLIGGIVIIVGALLVIKTEWIYNFTGPIDWAEQHLGTDGGTKLFIKLIGLILIFGTFLTLTGCTTSILRKVFNFSFLGGSTGGDATISE
ncbi:MAG: hypothetical protein ABIH38_05090 [Patescibacteria group bacterium]